MPILNKRDTKGSYYQIKSVKNKYYYIRGNKKSRENAKRKATKQLQAIKISQRKINQRK
jgi:hypothetical protein